ncbi:stalk domain-containing protein [Caldisericum exile]|uniref:stalk domain-containing protein n=1 Tax=Caldisericum exile TaxID=693075 RepID=UPI003C78DC08
MRKVLLVFLILFITVPFIRPSFINASTISSINPILNIGVPQYDFIGSAALAEVNFFEDDFDTRYIFPMQGITVTDDGYIAVIDNSYGRVHVLTPLLEEKFSFGSLRNFTYPTDIAYFNGNFYIVDPFRKEVKIYDKNGLFIRTLTNSNFTSPIGIAVTTTNIFVSDYFSNKIYKTDFNGKIISSIDILTPLGLTSDAKGYIYAVSGKESKIYTFDSTLRLLKTFGDGILVFPSDVSVDSKGNIYVVDRGLNNNSTNTPKVAIFNSNYQLVNTFGNFSNSTTSIPDGSFLTPSGIAVSLTNSVYVFDSGYYFFLQSNPNAPFGYPTVTRLSVFNTLGYFINKKDFIRDSAKGILLNPLSASLDENGNTWILNKGNLDQSEILKFGSDGSLVFRINKIGTQSLPSLISVYADKRGNVIAIGNNQILLLDSKGAFKQNIINSNFGLLKKITFYNGYYWATSQDKNTVFKFDDNFKIIGSFKVCKYPSGIAFDSKGRVFITSLEDNMVHVYDLKFSEIASFGGPGKSNFKLYIPEDVAVDDEGNIYVANTENGRITVFTNTFAPLFETDSQYLGISSVETENSHIIASDAFHNVVWVFEIKKQYLDYSFSVAVSPDVANISINDFVNIYFTVSNTGLKSDNYSFSVSLTNSNAFRFSIFEQSNTFSLAPNYTKRIRLKIESKDIAKIGDSTQVIIKVNSTNSGLIISSNSIVRVVSNLTPGILLDEGNCSLGENVSVPIYVKNPHGIRGISFDLVFDKNKAGFISLNLEPSFLNSVVLTNPTDTGLTFLIEFPKDNYIFNTAKIGSLVFKSVSIGSTILQIQNAKYATVTDEIVEFDNVYPGGITINPYLIVNIPDGFITTSQTITISGKTTPGCEVKINGLTIPVDTTGNFSYKLTLSSYLSSIFITSKAKTGEETTISRTIQFKGKLIISIILQINNPIMYVNGFPEEIDPGRGTAPVIIQGWNRTVVPIRAIVEKLGGFVTWDAMNRVVSIQIDKKTIELQIGNSIAKVNGKEVAIDPTNPYIKPLIINDRTMIPVRFVAEQIGCSITWNDRERKITIEYLMP